MSRHVGRKPKPVPRDERCIALTTGQWYAAPHQCPYRGTGSPRLCNTHRKAANRGPIYLAGQPCVATLRIARQEET